MKRIDQLSVYIIGMDGIDGIIAPVELADLVRTVVCTVTRANATVVDLQIEFLCLTVDRSKHGTYRLTGGTPALLTQHWLERRGLYFGIFALPKTLNTNPVQCATVASVLLTHKWQVVFHGAGGHTSLATGA